MNEGVALTVHPGQRIGNHMIDALVAREVERLRAEDAARQAAKDAEAERRMKEWQAELVRLTAKEGRMYESMTDMTRRRYPAPQKTRRQRFGDWCLGWVALAALGFARLLRLAERLGLIEWVGED